MKALYSTLGAALMLAALPAQALAQAVPICDGLTLYANAANTGLCRGLSPTSQNLWVCELADNPDIHLTFNAGTAMHLTVRNGTICEGLANLTGTFPGALAVAAGQPAVICGVTVANYIPRLNAVARLAPMPYVTTAINAAVGAQRISAGTGNSYIGTANANACP